MLNLGKGVKKKVAKDDTQNMEDQEIDQGELGGESSYQEDVRDEETVKNEEDTGEEQTM